jgi:hypothetical protein
MTSLPRTFFGETARGVATLAFAAALASALSPAAARADDLAPTPAPSMDHGAAMDHGATMHGDTMTMPPPPATLTWTSLAAAGQFMFGYTPSFSGMAGNYIGSTKVSHDYIATTIPSGQTHTMTMMGKKVTMPTMLRIVPDSMTMQMQNFNAMYGVTDSLSIMVMGSYVQKSMSMTTYSGMMGSTVLGSKSSTVDGLGDMMIGANYRIYRDAMNQIVVGLNLSLPTGSQTRQITMLSPMGSTMLMRAPYAMQTGTGTYDLLPALIYTGMLDRWSWGLAYRGRYALDNNPEGYHFGDLSEFHGWGGYTWLPGVTTTAHVVGSTQDHIHGADPMIYGLSQNANTDYYGGQRVTLLGGVELAGSLWGYSKSSFSVEAGGPVYQHLNGPQLGQAWQVTASARVMF